jgi:hypothetical protein
MTQRQPATNHFVQNSNNWQQHSGVSNNKTQVLSLPLPRPIYHVPYQMCTQVIESKPRQSGESLP